MHLMVLYNMWAEVDNISVSAVEYCVVLGSFFILIYCVFWDECLCADGCCEHVSVGHHIKVPELREKTSSLSCCAH
jgi:hypothetical protein